MLSDEERARQEPLIRWMASNGLRVDEGIPDPAGVYIQDGRIHLNLFGIDNNNQLCTVEAEADLRCEPPEELRISKR
jgi:hypothetical protein